MQDKMKLIQNGVPQYGIVSKPWAKINYLDFDYRTPMGRKISYWGKLLYFNHFQFFGVISKRLLFGCGQANTRVGGGVFCYLYDREKQVLKDWSFKDFGWLGTHTTAYSVEGKNYFKRGGKRIEFINRSQPRSKHLIVNLPGELQVDVSFSEIAPSFQPMCITTQAGNGWVYAEKIAGVKCQGTIRCSSGDFNMSKIGAYAYHDWSAGYMRRETFWNWACFSGKIANQSIGINLACGVNETSFTENCFWIDGKLYKTGPVQFQYDKNNMNANWFILSDDHKIKLQFTPEGRHQERTNLGLVASNFQQFFGCFNGEIYLPDQRCIKIKDQPGFVEDQYAKW